MFCERLKHVIEELHVGHDRRRATIEIQRQLDRGLFGSASDMRATHDTDDLAQTHGVSYTCAPLLAPLVNAEPVFPFSDQGRPRSSRGTNGVTGGPS